MGRRMLSGDVGDQNRRVRPAALHYAFRLENTLGSGRGKVHIGSR